MTMTARASSKFFSYLDGMATKVRNTMPKYSFRATMASSLCMHFWPELSRLQAEIVVDTWMGNSDAEVAAEEYAQ
jgi:hypothetical protein